MKLIINKIGDVSLGGLPLQEFDLTCSPTYPIFRLGRDAANDLVISDLSVSKSHAALVVADNKLHLRDLGSTNGTKLNSGNLTPFQWVIIRPGDEFQVGKAVLRLEITLQPAQFTGPSEETDYTKDGKISTTLQPAQFAGPTVIEQLEYPLPDKVDLPQLAVEVPVVVPLGWLSKGGLFWVYLLFISLAEFITAAVSSQLGLLLHALLLFWMLVYSAITSDIPARRFALSLSLAPLTRLLSLSLPLASFPQILWYPLVSVPLLLTTGLILRYLGLNRQTLNLQLSKLPLQLGLAGGGLGLGAIEYYILRPRPLLNELTWTSFLLPALNLIIFTGFNEELLFRGLLQNMALPVIRRSALIYVSILFAVLHIGYLSLSDLIFVFVVGLLFAYLALWSGSIIGVALAHGVANITMFVIMPSITQNPATPLAVNAYWIFEIGVLLALLSIVVIALQRGSKQH